MLHAQCAKVRLGLAGMLESCSWLSLRKTYHGLEGQHMIDWSPFEDPSGPMHTLCPLCGGYGEQKCLNCLGEGTVAPLQGTPAQQRACHCVKLPTNVTPLSHYEDGCLRRAPMVSREVWLSSAASY